MVNSWFATTANFASRSLRAHVCSVAASMSASSMAVFAKTFFTHCWVIVDPPCSEWPPALLSIARANAWISTPECSKKLASSTATIASTITWGIWSRSMETRLVVENSANVSPLRSTSCVRPGMPVTSGISTGMDSQILTPTRVPVAPMRATPTRAPMTKIAAMINPRGCSASGSESSRSSADSGRPRATARLRRRCRADPSSPISDPTCHLDLYPGRRFGAGPRTRADLGRSRHPRAPAPGTAG